MNKEPTRTIYDCLGYYSFWAKHKCLKCQKLFTSDDYLNQNYQLFFKEVLKTESYCLEVKVQLSHQQCPFSCGFSYQKDIICN